ncbi:hypothetical protein [Streptomyces sp. NPDC090131]|uniref:hypothetical protein n=1 Tax=Streptomyces sp. NPDC090131 TaxID=3365954 RepID=UPI0037F429A0
MGIKDQFKDKAQELEEKARQAQKPGNGPQGDRSQRPSQPKTSPQRSFDGTQGELDDRT